MLVEFSKHCTSPLMLSSIGNTRTKQAKGSPPCTELAPVHGNEGKESLSALSLWPVCSFTLVFPWCRSQGTLLGNPFLSRWVEQGVSQRLRGECVGLGRKKVQRVRSVTHKALDSASSLEEYFGVRKTVISVMVALLLWHFTSPLRCSPFDPSAAKSL